MKSSYAEFDCCIGYISCKSIWFLLFPFPTIDDLQLYYLFVKSDLFIPGIDHIKGVFLVGMFSNIL